jgi:hypothetical protein
MFLDNRLADVLVGEVVGVEKIIVKKVAEGSVADIVQQAGDAHVLFDVVCRRAFIA